MAKQKPPRPEEDFQLEHRQEGDKHFLKISPTYPCGYTPKEIEITEGQWNDLRYHFALGIDYEAKVDQLIYVV